MVLGLVDVILFTLLFWIGLYYYFARNDNYWKKRNVEYFEAAPFLGNIYEVMMLRKSIGEFMQEMYVKSKPSSKVVGMFIMDQPCLLIKDPQLIKRILVTDFQTFNDHVAIDNKRDDPIASNMLFVLKNPHWKEMRSKVTPIFTSAKIKAMHKVLEKSVADLVEYIGVNVEKGESIETREMFAKYTTDIITSTCFGINAHCFRDENAEFRVVARKLLDWTNLKVAIPMKCYFLAPRLVRLFRLKFMRGDCVQFFRDNFVKHFEERKRSKIVRKDLIDVLLELQQDENFDLDENALLGQVVMFFAAGLETTSTTLSYLTYELAMNPQIQSKFRQEVLEIYSKHEEFSNDAVNNMPYLDRVVKETLRKYPAFPFLDRRCMKDCKIPEIDLVVEKDLPVFISVLGLHHDPEFYPNPDVFDPDRFLEGTNQIYLAFGEGPRNCLGARFGNLFVKLAVCHLVRNFQMEPSAETPMKIVYEPNALVLAAINGLKIKFTKID